MFNITNSMANVTTSVASLTERLCMAIGLVILATIGLALYSIVIVTILQNAKSFQNPFYKLVCSLGLSDCGMLFLTMTYGSICIVKGGDSWASYEIRMVVSWIEAFLFYSLSYYMLVISLNRYVAVVHFTRYNDIFTNRNLLLMVVAIDVLSALMTTLYVVCNCYIGWLFYGWDFVCMTRVSCENVVLQTSAIIGVFIPVIELTLIYTFVFFWVKKSANKVQTLGSAEVSKRERKLMVQFAVICLLHLIHLSSFWYMFDLASLQVVTAIHSVLQMMDSSINPIMYLIFSSEIREKVSQMLLPGSATSTVVAGSTMTRNNLITTY